MISLLFDILYPKHYDIKLIILKYCDIDYVTCYKGIEGKRTKIFIIYTETQMYS